MALSLNIVVVGDGGCGKTCLIQTFCNNEYPDPPPDPTDYSNKFMKVRDGNRTVSIKFTDTAGQEMYKNIRKMAYPGTNAIIVCYDVGNEVSFENVIDKWLEEIDQEVGLDDIPICVVGTKRDIRRPEIDGEAFETFRNLKHVIKKDGRFNFFDEVSAIDNDNCRPSILKIMKIALDHKELKKNVKLNADSGGSCTVL